MPDEGITNNELARRLEYYVRDLQTDLGKIQADLSLLLPREVYDAHQAVTQEQIQTLRERIVTLESRGRWLWGVVAMPVIAVVLSWALTVWSTRP